MTSTVAPPMASEGQGTTQSHPQQHPPGATSSANSDPAGSRNTNLEWGVTWKMYNNYTLWHTVMNS